MTSAAPLTRPSYGLLQLHGGGALVLSEILKCAVIEEITARRIPDIFPTIIADSGGAISAMLLQKMTARELLKIYLENISDVLPNTRYLVTQPLAGSFKRGSTPTRFDPAPLQKVLYDTLGDMTLGDYQGHLVVSSVDMNAAPIDMAVTFESRYGQNKTESYPTCNQIGEKLYDVAMRTSAISGIMSPHDGQYADKILSLNPTPYIYEARQNNPDHDIVYVQMGSVVSRGVIENSRQLSFMRLLVSGKLQGFIGMAQISEHFQGARRILGDNAISFTTYPAHGEFNPTNNSPIQRTRVVVVTLRDIEDRANDYLMLVARLGLTAVKTNIPAILADIKEDVRGFLVQEKIREDKLKPEHAEQFPPPEIIRREDTARYKIGQAAKEFTLTTYDALRGTFIRAAGHIAHYTAKNISPWLARQFNSAAITLLPPPIPRDAPDSDLPPSVPPDRDFH